MYMSTQDQVEIDEQECLPTVIDAEFWRCAESPDDQAERATEMFAATENEDAAVAFFFDDTLWDEDDTVMGLDQGPRVLGNPMPTRPQRPQLAAMRTALPKRRPVDLAPIRILPRRLTVRERAVLALRMWWADLRASVMELL
jgi:hypothetical protein